MWQDYYPGINIHGLVCYEVHFFLMVYLLGMNKNVLGQQMTPEAQNCVSECVGSPRQMPGAALGGWQWLR